MSMKHKPQELREILVNLIQRLTDNPEENIRNPERDFLRNRKLPLDKLVWNILAMGGDSLTNELLKQSDCAVNIATSAAFVQQRAKLLPSAFENLFHGFVHKTRANNLFKGYRILAVDGSDIHIPSNKNDVDSLYQTNENRKEYNLLHLNALYDIRRHTYEDVVISKSRLSNENKALVDMVDRSEVDTAALIIADRGYESYNNMAHIKEKGWKYLIRIKDYAAHSSGILHGLKLPDTDEFDTEIDLNLTKKKSNEVKELLKDKNRYRCISTDKTFDYLPRKSKKSDPTVMYNLPFRIVRFKITDDTYEVVVTNLDNTDFPAQALKELYFMRWGIETSFRDLKYTVGLLHFHSKKVEYILQEIFARLIMYNFSKLIISNIIIEKKDRKYDYKVNFSVAVHICRKFLLGSVSPLNIETLIARYITPIRPGRSSPRRMTSKTVISFMYRVA